MRAGINRMLIQPWFIGLLALVLIHQIVQKVLDINIPLIDSFLDPILFMPILLHLILWERRYLFGKGPGYVLSWSQMLMVLIFVSILCEYFFPQWNDKFTMDYWDIVCYAIGAFIFGRFLNLPLKR